MPETEKPNCEYFRIDPKFNSNGNSYEVFSIAFCIYSDEYHQKATCEGKREKCAYPEKWEK